jgi:hypothetical protein
VDARLGSLEPRLAKRGRRHAEATTGKERSRGFGHRPHAWIVPIPGTTKLSRLEENLGAAAIQLTSGDLHDIESAASKITVEGARYPESSQRLVNR